MMPGQPNNSLKLTRRAGPWGGFLSCPLASPRVLAALPASAGQLSSRPLDGGGIPPLTGPLIVW
jgi:hypothetical protein